MNPTRMVCLGLCLLAATALAQEAIWIEGETPTRAKVFKHGWYSSVKKELLSGGEWISNYSNDPEAWAEYRFPVKTAGDYTLWVRCNPTDTSLEYSLDGAPAAAIDLASDPRGRVLISATPDFRALAWFKVGPLALTTGEHSLRFTFTSQERHHGGIDCLCLVNFAWVPAGREKPAGASEPLAALRPPEPAPTATGQPVRPAAPRVAAPRVLPGLGSFVWIEGEDAVASSFVKNSWYSGVRRELLSGGDWLSNYADSPGGAQWQFTIDEAGDYTWWVRCNPARSALAYSLDNGPLTTLDMSADPRDRINLVEALDHRFMAWLKLGTVKLAAGPHNVKIVLFGDLKNSGGIDCLCFVNFPWVPSGVERPKAPTPTRVPAPDEWFVFTPDDDSYSDQSIIDLSSLLHKPAGRYGFLQRRGKDLVFEQQGTPVKLWGLGARMARTPQLQEQQARLYAKYGLNMLRTHTLEATIGLLVKDPVTGKRDFDPKRIDQWDRWFATLKNQGIYSTLSCFYPHEITPDDGYPTELYEELPPLGKGRSSSGVVNFVPALQQAEEEWLKALLLHKNPYTGLRYIDDPAVAVLEIHNDDCIFWHAPLNDLAATPSMLPRHSALLKRLWMEWLQKRYGDDARLRVAWGGGMKPGDSVSNPAMSIYGAWEMAAAGPERDKVVATAERKRMGDFIRFLAETQRAYYEGRETMLRRLGYKGLTVTTAWRAGGPAADPANLWCDDAMDMIDRHSYFGGGAGGHSITPGKVDNGTHLAQPGSGTLSSGLYQVEDKPFCMTAWTQMPPNQWKAECAPLMAFYMMGLQGMDISYHVAGSRPRMGAGWPDLRSYITETPHYLGQFPALAFALYKGHITEGPLVAARRLKLDDIFQGIDALSQDFTGGGYDAKALQGNLATPQEVLAIGRVTAKVADGQQSSFAMDWSRYWDKTTRIVRSATGELTWDYGKRVVTLQTPKTQAVVGFAGGSEYDLPGVKVQVKTPFVSLLFTPLDDKPLAESGHILITALARDQQKGAEYNQDGTELLKTGEPVLMLEPVQATVTLKGGPITSVRVVDLYGVPTKQEVQRQGNTFSLDGRYATYYYEVLRQ